MRRCLVLLNARAGVMIDYGASRIRDDLAAAFASSVEELDIRVLKPRELGPAIRAARDEDHDAVIVGGGDGTANALARTFAGTGRVVGILPFGTMNLLARDLGMPADPREAIEAMAHAEPRLIDLGTIQGKPFHTLSGLGFFSQLARAREETRGHPFGRMTSVALAIVRALRRSGSFSLDIVVDGRHEELDAMAVLVTNNHFEADWRRPRLDTGLLEVHIAEDAGTIAKLRTGAEVLTGTWRESSGIRSILAREVTIDRRRSRTWASTDGEIRREHLPIRYAILPKSLNVLGV